MCQYTHIFKDFNWLSAFSVTQYGYIRENLMEHGPLLL